MMVAVAAVPLTCQDCLQSHADQGHAPALFRQMLAGHTAARHCEHAKNTHTLHPTKNLTQKKYNHVTLQNRALTCKL
jgi:hypothetical protein